MVGVLLKHGADLGSVCVDKDMMSRVTDYNDLILSSGSTYKGTPIWYAIAMDRVNILHLLEREYGLLKRYKVHRMLVLAIDAHALKCAGHLSGVLVEKTRSEVRKIALPLACKRGIALVRLFLNDTDFGQLLDSDPDVLYEYYSNVGRSKAGREASCAEFTKLTLANITDKSLLQRVITCRLLHALLDRCTTNLSTMSECYRVDYYSDIRHTLSILVKYNGCLPSETPEMVLKTVHYAREFSCMRKGQVEWVEILKLTAHLVDLGFSTSESRLLHVVGFPSHKSAGTKSIKPKQAFIDEYVRLVLKCLSQGSQVDGKDKDGRNVFYIFLNRTFEKAFSNSGDGVCLAHQVSLFTKVLEVMCDAGLDVNTVTEVILPENPQGGRMTHFQRFINTSQFLLHNDVSMDGIPHLVASYAVMAGQRVDFFHTELKHGDCLIWLRAIEAWLYRELGKIKVSSVDHRQVLLGSPQLRILFEFLRHFLTLMPPADADQLVEVILMHMAEKGVPHSQYRLLEDLVQFYFQPSSAVLSLKALCCFTIKDELNKSPRGFVRYGFIGCGGSNSGSGDEPVARGYCFGHYSKRVADWPEFQEKLSYIKSYGIHIGRETTLEWKLLTLELPKSLHEQVLGFNNLLEAVINILEIPIKNKPNQTL